MLNESLAPKQILSEGLKHHMDNNKPLTEHLYRAGSTNYFNLWAEARSLYSREILEITNEDDLAVLTETHLGHFGILEDGTKVPLDFPIELNEEVNSDDLDNAIYRLEKVLKYLDIEYKETRRGEKYIQINYIPVTSPQSYNPEFVNVRYNNDEDLGVIKKRLGLSMLDEGASLEERISKIVTEAKKKKAKKNDNKKLNKPMRDSSGGKAYKVYVKDPKTGNIKTIRFGSGGLKAKINNKTARNAYAARHKCSTRNDKTKASYWSCRLPRYAKLLGLKSSFTGFW
tara:strand:+ start:175 stop:1029 length:855 start_codon:yes stop_codon:yes gene_type:complete